MNAFKMFMQFNSFNPYFGDFSDPGLRTSNGLNDLNVVNGLNFEE